MCLSTDSSNSSSSSSSSSVNSERDMPANPNKLPNLKAEALRKLHESIFTTMDPFGQAHRSNPPPEQPLSPKSLPSSVHEAQIPGADHHKSDEQRAKSRCGNGADMGLEYDWIEPEVEVNDLPPLVRAAQPPKENRQNNTQSVSVRTGNDGAGLGLEYEWTGPEVEVKDMLPLMRAAQPAKETHQNGNTQSVSLRIGNDGAGLGLEYEWTEPEVEVKSGYWMSGALLDVVDLEERGRRGAIAAGGQGSSMDESPNTGNQTARDGEVHEEARRLVMEHALGIGGLENLRQCPHSKAAEGGNE